MVSIVSSLAREEEEGDQPEPEEQLHLLASPLLTTNGTMAPRPYDDGLFIEPAGDYDVVYGDYNATMGDGTPSGKRPYIRLTGALRNMSRPVGGEVRMRCEAAGSPLPVQFTWLKNLAPVEKNRRMRIRHREMSSKLVIVELDVLDSGYYQCTANNAAGSVNSTAVLRVSPSASISSPAKKKPAERVRQQLSHQHQDNDDYYDNYVDEEMKTANDDLLTSDSGQSASNNDVWRVPNSAAGPGYVPLRRGGGGDSDGRWLDGQVVRKDDCIAYRGEACAQYLAGKHVKVLVDREHIYDAEKDLLAALMTVRVMPGVSEQCRQFSHQVACYHMFKLCDPNASAIAALASPASTDIISLCREDCDSLKNQMCPNEFAMAAQHDLVGDAPKALLPSCEALIPGVPHCLSVLDKRPHSNSLPLPADASSPASSSSSPSHWCYVGAGTKYQGIASTTRGNRPCIYWPNEATSEFNTDSHPQLRNAKNHCRNPSRRSQFNEPWCYTVTPGNTLLAEPCNVPRCPPNLYPDLEDSSAPSSQSPSVLSALSSLWLSLSSQSQVLALFSGLGLVAVLLTLLALFCFCCRSGGNGRRRKGSRAGTATRNGFTGQGMGRGAVQQESASSMLSGSVVAQKMQGSVVGSAAQQNGSGPQGMPPPLMHPHQVHQHMLMQSCNGGSTITNSDLNSAFYRKVRDERMRAAGAMASDEMLNPLLSYDGLHQQQMFEMQKQQQQQQFGARTAGGGYWESGQGTLNSQTINGYPPPSNAYYLPQQQPYGSTHTTTEPPPESYQIASIQEQQLQFSDRLLGEDGSTQLMLGEWLGGMISGAALKVALKTLKPGMPHIAVEQFREEIQVIGYFEHPNVVRLFGVSFLQGRDLCAVFDYMVHGDLVEFLKVREPRGDADNDEQERARNAEDFLRIGTQITSGCQYLAANNFVHRDLAARNCLVGDQQIIKIADFARMKPHYERDYYKLNANSRGMPLRWLAKEVLNEGKYSEASDVYAFGMCLWEIYTYARQPYERHGDEQVIRLIQEEMPPEMPEFCPSAVYAQMVECFNPNPLRRPSFAELHSKFQKWCTSGQPSALQMQQHRASSVHSGGSSSGVNGMVPMNGRNAHRGAGGGGVPSPAPNGSTTILAGNMGQGPAGTRAHLAKLALLSKGASIVHSTPIGQNSSDDGSLKKRPIPPVRRRPPHQRVAYTDEEEAAELGEEEDEYSSETESRES